MPTKKRYARLNRRTGYSDFRSGQRGSAAYASQVPKRARDSEDRYDANQTELRQMRKDKPPTGLSKSEMGFYEKALRKRQKALSSRTPLTDSEQESRKINSDLAKSSKAARVDDKRMTAQSQRKWPSIPDAADSFYRRWQNTSKPIARKPFKPAEDRSKVVYASKQPPASNQHSPANRERLNELGKAKTERAAQARRDLAVKRLRGKRPIKPGER